MTVLGDEVRAAAVLAGCPPGDPIGDLIDAQRRHNDELQAKLDRNVVPMLDKRELRLAANGAVSEAVERELVALSDSWVSWAIKLSVVLQPLIFLLLLFLVLRG